MKIGLIGDVHLHNFPQFNEPLVNLPAAAIRLAGANARAHWTAAVLENALVDLRAAGCTEAVQLGDLFETPHVTASVLGLAPQAVARSGLDMACVLGNHDAHATPADWCNSAHAVFLCSSSIRGARNSAEWDSSTMSGNLVGDYGAVASGAFRRAYQGQTSFLHAGLWSESESLPLMAGKHDLCVERDLWGTANEGLSGAFPGPRIVAAGHWHHARHFGQRRGVQVLQAGVLNPTGFKDEGWAEVGWVYAFDDQTGVLESFQIPGLRFLNVHDVWQGILDLRMVYALGCMPIVAVHAETAKAAAAMRDELLELFGQSKTDGPASQRLTDATCVLRVHPPEAPAQFTRAAMQSKEAYAVRAAARMPLVEEAERGRLAQRILAHWKD